MIIRLSWFVVKNLQTFINVVFENVINSIKVYNSNLIELKK
jgi:hypothetical protein